MAGLYSLASKKKKKSPPVIVTPPKGVIHDGKGKGKGKDGGKGKGKDGKKDDKKPDFWKRYKPGPVPKTKLRRRAARDVRLFNQPALNELRRQGRQVRDEYTEANKAAKNIYQGLKNELQRIPGVEYGDISGDLANVIGQMGQQMGDFGVGPAGETAAASGLFGQVGVGAQEALAGQRARTQAFDASIGQQAAVDLSNQRANYLEAMRDAIDEVRQGRMDIFQDMGEQRKQRLDELRDVRFQQGMDRAAYGLQAQEIIGQNKLRKYLIEKLREEIGKTDSKGGPKKGNNKPAKQKPNKQKDKGDDNFKKDSPATHKGKIGKFARLTKEINDLKERINDIPPGTGIELRKKLEKRLRNLKRKRRQLKGQS